MRLFNGSGARMPNTFRQADRLSPEDETAERLLSGCPAGPGAPAGQQAVALVLQAASRPASERELSGEDAAVAAFLAVAGPARTSGSRARTRGWLRAPSRTRAAGWPRVPTVRVPTLRVPTVRVPTLRVPTLRVPTLRVPTVRVPARSGSRPLTRRFVVLVLACLVAATVALGGTAAAGSLPAPLQMVAHTMFGAPAPQPVAPRPVAPPSPGRTPPSGHSRGRAIIVSHPTSSPKPSASSPATKKAKAPKKPKKPKKPKDNSKNNSKGNSAGNGNGNGNGKKKGHHKTHGNGNGKKKSHEKDGVS